MPVNKSARVRFEILDECLRNNKKRWTKAELLRSVNRQLELRYGHDASISVSQLRYDLESLQTEFGAPVEMYREGRTYLYRYEDPSFSIRNIPVDEEDLQKLGNAVSLLQQIRGFTIAEEMAEIVKRLESRYKYSGPEAVPIIAFESSPEMQGVENLEDIYHAILRQSVLRISYQAFNATEPRQWHVHPYLLKEHSHRWYLLGLCAEKGNAGIYALDRMKDIRVVQQPFIPNTIIHGDDYFSDVIGVTVHGAQSFEHVEILFSAKMAPYVQTKPLHRSQEVVQQYENGALLVRLRVHVNPELIALLLSYGAQLKVLRPQGLAETLHVTATEMLQRYELENDCIAAAI